MNDRLKILDLVKAVNDLWNARTTVQRVMAEIAMSKAFDSLPEELLTAVGANDAKQGSLIDSRMNSVTILSQQEMELIKHALHKAYYASGRPSKQLMQELQSSLNNETIRRIIGEWYGE